MNDPALIIPKDLKRLRSCLSCQLIKDGCQNCGSRTRGSAEAVEDLTTEKFYGCISLLEGDSEKSWVARYLEGTFPTDRPRLPGAYSMKVYETAEDTYEEDQVDNGEEDSVPRRAAAQEDESEDEDYVHDEGDDNSGGSGSSSATEATATGESTGESSTAEE